MLEEIWTYFGAVQGSRKKERNPLYSPPPTSVTPIYDTNLVHGVGGGDHNPKRSFTGSFSPTVSRSSADTRLGPSDDATTSSIPRLLRRQHERSSPSLIGEKIGEPPPPHWIEPRGRGSVRWWLLRGYLRAPDVWCLINWPDTMWGVLSTGTCLCCVSGGMNGQGLGFIWIGQTRNALCLWRVKAAGGGCMKWQAMFPHFVLIDCAERRAGRGRSPFKTRSTRTALRGLSDSRELYWCIYRVSRYFYVRVIPFPSRRVS